jgi:hypothetical protein
MRSLSEQICRKNPTHNCVQQRFPESHAVYEIMWKIWYRQTDRQTDRQATDDNATRRMRITYWTRQTQSEHVTLCYSTATIATR